MEAKASRAQSEPFQLSLRIRHPSIDPAEISRALGIEAEHSFRAGEPRVSSSGVAIAAVHNESYWLATLRPEVWLTALARFVTRESGESSSRISLPMSDIIERSLDVALSLCVTNVLRPRSAFIREMQASDGEVRLIVSFAPRRARAFTLTPEVSRALAELKVPVDFELGQR